MYPQELHSVDDKRVLDRLDRVGRPGRLSFAAWPQKPGQECRREIDSTMGRGVLPSGLGPGSNA